MNNIASFNKFFKKKESLIVFKFLKSVLSLINSVSVKLKFKCFIIRSELLVIFIELKHLVLK